MFESQGRDFFDSIPAKVKNETRLSVECKFVLLSAQHESSFWGIVCLDYLDSQMFIHLRVKKCDVLEVTDQSSC